MAEQTDSKIPQIRFKGFEGEWVEKRLGELGKVSTNKRIFMHQTSPVGDVPFFKIGTFGREPKLFISKKLFEEYIARFPHPQKGDLLISVIGSIGRIVEYSGEPEYFQDSNVVWLQHNGAIINPFLKQFYSIVEWSGLEGSTIKHLYNRNILETKIDLPSKDEQTQIGGYFKELDGMIGLHQRKHGKLVTLKQAMLQKMFPQNGATTPEIRFKGFEGNWEEKTLGDLFPITSAARVHKNEWTKSGVPFFRSSDVVSAFKGKANTEAFISCKLYEELSAKVGRIKKGDMLVTGGGSIGVPYLVPSDDPLYFKDADLLWFKIRESVDSYFLYTFFSSAPFGRYVKSISHIGTIAHYTVEQAKETPLLAPSEMAEQAKIGSYFSNLDTLISKHATQLEKLMPGKDVCLSPAVPAQ
jgi:type I restriction enzyme S subunit